MNRLAYLGLLFGAGLILGFLTGCGRDALHVPSDPPSATFIVHRDVYTLAPCPDMGHATVDLGHVPDMTPNCLDGICPCSTYETCTPGLTCRTDSGAIVTCE